MPITPDHKSFAREVVALARQHNMDHLRFSFRFGWDHPNKGDDDHWGEIEMSWEEPREGPDTLHISATERTNVDVSLDPETDDH